MTVPSPTLTRLHVALLTLLCLVLFVHGIGQMQFKHEEPRRALIAEEMAATGEWMVPHLNGQPYLAKPPLFNWLIVAASIPFGEVNEAAARLPSAMSALGIALLVYFWGRTFIGARGALIAGAVAVTCGLFLEKGPVAEIDMNFGLWVVGSLAFLFRGFELESSRPWHLPLAYAFLAAAFLTKGPPALLFFAVAVAALAWIHRSAKPLLSSAHAAGLVVFVLPVALWLLAVHNAVGISALFDTARSELVDRAADTSALNPLEWFYYPANVLLGFLPWSPLLLLAIPLWKHDADTPRARLLRFNLLCAAGTIILFSLAAGKEARYMLPILPGLALVVGDALDRYLTGDLPERWLTVGRRVLSTLGALLVPGAVVIGVIARLDWEAPTFGAIAMGLVVLLLALVGLAGHRNGVSARLLLAIALIACVYRVGNVQWYVPHTNARYDVSPIVDPINATVRHAPPYVVSFNTYLVLYYLDQPAKRFLSIEDLAEAARWQGGAVCIVYEDERAALEALQPRQWIVAHEFEYRGRPAWALKRVMAGLIPS